MTADMPLYIVLNHASGGVDGALRERIIRRVLDETGRAYQILQTRRPDQLQTLAEKAVELARGAHGAVVVAGGDGTINAVAGAVLRSELPFGILAQGTFNYTGRCHGIPEDFELAVRSLLQAQVKPIQVGLVNDHPFLVNASLGLYPRLLEEREGFKQRFGRKRIVAMASGLVSLLRHYRRLGLLVDCDGESRTLETSTVVVGNNRLQLQQIGMARADHVTRGKLIGIAVKPVSAAQLIWLAVRGLSHRLGEADAIIELEFKQLNIQPRGAIRRRHVQVAVDGEQIRMRFPLTFRIAQQPLQLLVPRDAGMEPA